MGAYGTTAMACGTTAGASGTTAPRSSTTACLRTATLGILLFAKYEENGGCSKAQRERRCKESKHVRDDSTLTFSMRTPLNSMAFLRLNSTEKKHRETPSSIGSEGHRIVLCLDMKYLKCSMHTISLQMHGHQSPKPLRQKYALTISSFLVD